MAFNRSIILYLHIPKTGGSTLNQVVYNQLYNREACEEKEDWQLDSGVFHYPAGYVREPDSSKLARIQRVLSSNDLRAVVGHFHFGIHRYLGMPSTYITLLRDPVDRVLSLFHFHKLVENDWGEHEGVKMREGTSLEEFVQRPLYKEADNGQTRRVSGITSEVGGCTRSMLIKAKENLRQYFSIVGVADRFDETLILLKQKLGWTKDLLYYPTNTNPHRPSITSLSPRTLDAIRARNELDCELYEFAKDLLEAAILSEGPTFLDELEDFKSRKQIWYENIAAQRLAKKRESTDQTQSETFAR